MQVWELYTFQKKKLKVNWVIEYEILYTLHNESIDINASNPRKRESYRQKHPMTSNKH